ncbi:MAG: glyoxalase [Pseudobacteriovorax sp.]|nr:glyoxalase [Pseudobacteriovorax sp.]
MKCLDLKCFVPAKNHSHSKKFYKSLGFKENWSAGNLSEFAIGDFRFLLQDFYDEALAKNMMLHLLVDSAQEFYDDFADKVDFSQYPGASIEPPEMQPWGMRVAYMRDPSGVLWHIAETSAV